MNLREEIEFLTTGKTPVNKKDENKLMESFINSFKEDVKEYGLEEATALYATVYGIEEMSQIDEDMFENLTVEYIKEDRTRSAPASSSSSRTGIATSSAVKSVVPSSPNSKPKLSIWDKKEAMLDPKIKTDLSALSDPKGEKSALLAAGKPGLLAGIWNKIKNFTTGQFSSIKNIVKTGNWSALTKLPIFKGALAAGGVVAVIAILKKLLKNKFTKEQEAQLRAAKK